MMQVIQMTQKEKMKMYMKLSKKELAVMLINCNKMIDNLCPQPVVSGQEIYNKFRPNDTTITCVVN